tara:strand:- start:509 stop:835 length:327 start_codon:yes stop_codon:yes gene_type:complete
MSNELEIRARRVALRARREERKAVVEYLRARAAWYIDGDGFADDIEAGTHLLPHSEQLCVTYLPDPDPGCDECGAVCDEDCLCGAVEELLKDCSDDGYLDPSWGKSDD